MGQNSRRALTTRGCFKTNVARTYNGRAGTRARRVSTYRAFTHHVCTAIAPIAYLSAAILNTSAGPSNADDMSLVCGLLTNINIVKLKHLAHKIRALPSLQHWLEDSIEHIVLVDANGRSRPNK